MNYYAVERSTDHLAHYGVKGMKWGVRKAIQKGSDKKLSRQYAKAQKKLEKLNSKVDVDVQRLAAAKHKRRAIAALGLGTGLGARTIIKNKNAAQKIVEDADHAYNGFYQNYPGGTAYFSPRRKKIVGEGKGIYIHGEGLGTGSVAPTGSAVGVQTAVNGGGKAVSSGSNPFITRDRIGKALIAAGLGTAAYQTGRAIAAKRRTTKSGHKKAIEKRNAWQNEMKKAFSGTKYANQYPAPQKTKKKRG